MAGGQVSPIQPDDAHPFYWRYKGEPSLPLGGSKTDNLFQIPELEEHLDQLVSVGGNYVRNTMSSRKAGNLFPYAMVEGQYDLEHWNHDYWQRFERFLHATPIPRPTEHSFFTRCRTWTTTARFWHISKPLWTGSCTAV